MGPLAPVRAGVSTVTRFPGYGAWGPERGKGGAAALDDRGPLAEAVRATSSREVHTRGSSPA